MSANDEDLSIGADISPFRRSMAQLQGAGRDAARGVEGSFRNLSAPLEAVRGSALALTAAIAVVTAGVREAVGVTAQMADDAINLGRALNISATEAGVWAQSAQNVNASAGEFESAAAGLTERLKEQEERLNSMGLVTRDASGEFRNFSDLMADGIEVVNSYKAGTDRNLAANTIFGEALKGNSELLRLNRTEVSATAERMRELGILVAEDNVQAYREFQAAGDDLGMVFDGLKRAVGDALMPVLTEMSGWASAVAPAAITVVKGAVGGLVTAFWTLQNGVVVVWETINSFVYSVAEPLVAVSESISLAMSGEFESAGDRIMGVSANIEAQWQGAFDRMAENSAKASEKIRNIWSEGAPAALEDGDGESFKPQPKPTGSAKTEPSQMGDYRARLDAMSVAYSMENQLRDFSKEQELAYWAEVSQAANVSAKDREQIARTMARLELEIAREKSGQLVAIDQLRADAKRAESMALIDEAERMAEHQVRTGEVTETELLALREQFLVQREAIEMGYLQRKIEAAQLDPESNPVLLEQLEIQKLEIRRRYAEQQAEVARQTAVQTGSGLSAVFNGLEGQLTRLGNTMLTNWQGIGSAMAGVLSSIGGTIIQETITRPLAAKVAAWATERGLTIASIGAKSASAGAGAAAATSSIPIVGPILALAAMAAIMAAVGGLTSSVPSAAGGFDIPKGLNPLTQLHEEEMVLPKNLANTVRGLAGEDGEQGPAPAPVALSINAVDSRSVERLFRDNGHILASALRDAVRDYSKG